MRMRLREYYDSGSFRIVLSNFILLILLNVCYAQTTVTYLSNVQITYTNRGTKTDFTITSPLGNNVNPSSSWVGIGFNSKVSMDGATVSVCMKTSTISQVRTYINSGYSSVLLDANDPSLGITNPSITVNGGVITCSFSRDNSNANSRYFDLSRNNPYILVAYGSLSSSNIGIHSARMVTPSVVNIASSAPTTTTTTARTVSTTSTASTTTVLSYASSLTLVSNVQISYTKRGSVTDFSISSPLGSGVSVSNAWIGIGFNSDKDMNGASVVVCKNSASVSRVEHYYNENYNSVVLDSSNPTLGITNGKISVNQGVLTCTFTRDNSNSNSKYFDLNTKNPYIIAAYGSMSSSNILPHSNQAADESSTQIAFVSNAQVTTTTAPSTVQAASQSAGSFESNGFKLTWTNSKDSTKFVMTVPANLMKKRDVLSASISGISNRYSAIAFSKDTKMGDDCVVACIVSGTTASIQHYYNNGKTSSVLLASNPSVGLSEFSATVNNGQLQCTFTRAKLMSGVENYFDLSNKYYLLMAQGSVSGGTINYHGANNRISSTSLIDFQSSASVVSTENHDKTKTHGCLMVIAWMFFASTGILFARYYKYIFPTLKYFDVAFWFNAHRFSMIFVPVLSFIAFIVILAESDWKWIDQTILLNFVHSIIGITTIGLSFFQVILGLLRPDKDHKYRFVFNHAHRIIGISTFVLSIVTIFLGVLMDEMNLGRVGWGITIGWTLWIVLLPLIIEILDTSLINKIDTYQVSDNEVKKSDEPNKSSKKCMEGFKTFLMFSHLLIALGFVVALIVVIAIAAPNKFPV